MNTKAFTLVELVVVIAVICITLAIAIPPFASLMALERMSTASGALNAAIIQARHEAVRSAGMAVISANGNWQNGWVVFQDANGNFALDPAERVLSHHSGLHATLSVAASGPMASQIAFSSTGQAIQPSGAFLAGTLVICLQQELLADRLILNASGRIRVEKRNRVPSC